MLDYSAVRLAVLIAFGFTAALLARLADQGRQRLYVALFVFLFVGFHLFAAVQALSIPSVAAIPQPMLWIAGLAASAFMVWYFLLFHPGIRQAQSW